MKKKYRIMVYKLLHMDYSIISCKNQKETKENAAGFFRNGAALA
jgi:hypothetical protein